MNNVSDRRSVGISRDGHFRRTTFLRSSNFAVKRVRGTETRAGHKREDSGDALSAVTLRKYAAANGLLEVAALPRRSADNAGPPPLCDKVASRGLYRALSRVFRASWPRRRGAAPSSDRIRSPISLPSTIGRLAGRACAAFGFRAALKPIRNPRGSLNGNETIANSCVVKRRGRFRFLPPGSELSANPASRESGIPRSIKKLAFCRGTARNGPFQSHFATIG